MLKHVSFYNINTMCRYTFLNKYILDCPKSLFSFLLGNIRFWTNFINHRRRFVFIVAIIGLF